MILVGFQNLESLCTFEEVFIDGALVLFRNKHVGRIELLGQMLGNGRFE